MASAVVQKKLTILITVLLIIVVLIIGSFPQLGMKTNNIGASLSQNRFIKDTHPNGEWLAVNYEDTIFIVEISSGEALSSVEIPDGREPLTMEWTQTGNKLVVAGANFGSSPVFYIFDYCQLPSEPQPEIIEITHQSRYSWEDRHIAIGNGQIQFYHPDLLTIFRYGSNGTHLPTVELTGYDSGLVRDEFFSGDGKFLFSYIFGGNITVFNTYTGNADYSKIVGPSYARNYFHSTDRYLITQSESENFKLNLTLFDFTTFERSYVVLPNDTTQIPSTDRYFSSQTEFHYLKKTRDNGDQYNVELISVNLETGQITRHHLLGGIESQPSFLYYNPETGEILLQLDGDHWSFRTTSLEWKLNTITRFFSNNRFKLVLMVVFAAIINIIRINQNSQQ